ncbi:MAG: 1-acyl-sn-glycerol-3-phosphate acyltransferase [Alistipes sp.]|nr:1-acyl-sn-glycerol-3-phosphate acyltransferase [Alistipes sp.]
MAKQKKVQDNSPLYNFLRYYVDLALFLSYRNVRYVGRERIPTDGAIIYAPNHTNALMDALVLLAMDRKPKVFVARADIFRNPKLAKLLTWLKIMPVMRIRDGYEEVKKNNDTFERAVDVLRDKIPFCIFPEGTHQAKFSSLPLSKGIFRIALQAQEMMPDMPLYIVPVGMRYGSFFRFRSTVRVQIGEPINVGKFIAAHNTLTPAELMVEMKEELTERMQNSIFYIPNDEHYDAKYEICAAVVKQQAKRLKGVSATRRPHQLDLHFEANNLTVNQIEQMIQNEPAKAEQLLRLGDEASKMRRAQHISLASVSVKYPTLSRILKVLFVLVALPYCIPVSVLTLPINMLCAFIFTKLRDHAFRNSVRYLINLLVWPLLMIIYSIVAYATLPWQWALPITLALLPAPIVAHETWRLLRLGISDIKLLFNSELRAKYRKIREIVFNKLK